VNHLREAIVRLGPWHHDIEVTPEVSTRVSLEEQPEAYPEAFGPVSFLSWRDQYLGKLLRIYSNGLEGRTVLDCGCNCGECLFWAKEIGAGDCFGFDVREHWIEQARFLQEHRTVAPTEGTRFEVCDLYTLPELGLESFDITLFHGLLYHLPDPVSALRIAADLTKEVIFVSTATRSGLPDGLLAVGNESKEQLLSGVHGLNWLPTGPDVVMRILEWLGFEETTLLWWQEEVENQRGRLEVVASREKGLLERAP